MAQLRQDYDQFINRQSSILVIGPEDATTFRDYFTRYHLLFTGLPDPTHSVLKLYGQQVKLFKFGRMPAQIIVDKHGNVRFIHYGHDMSDIPTTEEVLGLLDRLNLEK